jgi:Bifunctional DNA primase/polymerase, N-terminal
VRYQALGYARAGWPVFPTRPDASQCPDPGRCQCKTPLTPHGFKDATCDPGQIRAWWRRWPDANVGIATGAPGPDVLDIDVDKDGSGYAALGKLVRAGVASGASLMTRTPRGGAHVYYAGSRQGCHRLGRHHLDFRSTGGYVVGPGSIIHGREYRILDQRPSDATLDWDAVIRVLDPPQRRKPTPATAWAGCGLPPTVQRALAAEAHDRSAALFRLVGACARSGMDEGTIYRIAAAYPPALEKYGARLTSEIGRCLRRIGAP